MLRRCAVLILFYLLVACGAVTGQPQATLIPAETLEPLEKTVNYWDMGLTLNYPRNWADPQFTSGQVTLARSLSDAGAQPVVQPVVTVNLVDPAALNLSTDASLQDILSRVSLGPDVSIRESQNSMIAGLDSFYMALLDQKLQVSGYTSAFRLPDGRVGTYIAIAPTTIWAYVVPDFDKIRQTARLLKPADYTLPATPTESMSFAPGGMTFLVPKDWIRGTMRQAALYHDKAIRTYADNSGFANGPLITIVVRPIAKEDALLSALDGLIGALPGDTIKDITVSGQPAYEMESSDPATGQTILFVGVKTVDSSGVILLRWTAPGMLREVLRPTFNAIVQSIRLSPVSSQ